MNRRDFIKGLAALGLAPSALSLLEGCQYDVGGRYDGFAVNFTGKVVIVGAGASGLAAGYLLSRYGIDFEILEASSVFGGRVRRADDFVDFPIDLGAEWIHDHPSILAKVLDDPTLDATVDVVPYSPDSIHTRSGDQHRSRNWATNYYGEYKFKSTTWYGFLERFIVPTFADRITYDSPVSEIDTTGPGVRLTTAAGRVVEADRVLLTVPIKVLQDRMVSFVPALPADKVDAIDRVHVPHGLKVFLEFDQRFYPDITLDGPLLGSDSSDKIYYDAAFRKDTASNVLGLFYVADRAVELTSLDDDAIGARVIEDLDGLFDGKASRYYRQHIVQNWSSEPYVRGAYSYDFRGSQSEIVDALRRPVADRLFFSGEALSISDQATVQGAMLSAYAAVEEMLA